MAQGLQLVSEHEDVTAINLRRALSRLEQKILTSPDPRLVRSSYERTKTSSNLEYARTLLLRLEHECSNLKIQSRKQERQKALLAQRALIKRLTERLHELDHQDSGVSSPDTDDEDLLGAHVQTSPSATTAMSSGPADSNNDPHEKETALEANARNRFQSSNPTSSPSTSKSTALSANHGARQLESNSTEQMDLTSSMVSLVAQLKSSTLAFSSSLDLDNEALARAQEGLEKNESGLEAAGKRMGMLRRMSEGKGWWGRMMLYAWIGGLWIVAIGLVFIGPKFRF
ncbi:MAG: hypothetical protein Q9219_003747 [cf. Caloplaca sp. 3 TL-2023]